jgi:co-chaperonin GroES (HSP10)
VTYGNTAASRLLLAWCAAQVLYSKFGFMYTELKMGDEEFILIREDDVIGE